MLADKLKRYGRYLDNLKRSGLVDPAAPNMLKTGGPQQHALLAIAGTMAEIALNAAPSILLLSCVVDLSFTLSSSSKDDDSGCCLILVMAFLYTSGQGMAIELIALFSTYCTIRSMMMKLIFAFHSNFSGWFQTAANTSCVLRAAELIHSEFWHSKFPKRRSWRCISGDQLQANSLTYHQIGQSVHLILCQMFSYCWEGSRWWNWHSMLSAKLCNHMLC